jgi:hypothetical protein
LNDPDFTTATRLAVSVNKGMGDDIATVMDGASIRVRAPLDSTQRVSFLSSVENLQVEPGSAAAKVIINSRTGTVVISSNVIVSPAAVSHGSLSVSIKEEQSVSQPAPFSKLGQTVVTSGSTIKVDQGSNRMFLFKPGVELEQIVRAINDVGAAPGDLVAILEALREAGAAGRAHRDLNDHQSATDQCNAVAGVRPDGHFAATTYTISTAWRALKKDPNSPQAISAVAQQVEALFLQMMLKSMRDAGSSNNPTATR